MIRFTTKSLMFLTAVVASYALIWTSALNSATWPLLVGLVSLACLVAGRVFYDLRADGAMMNERADGAKPPE
jgi:hypothetical protein